MSIKKFDVGQAEHRLVINGALLLLRPVLMSRRRGDVPADWQRFVRGSINYANLTTEQVSALQEFLRANNTEAATDSVSCFTLDNGRLAYCDPAAVADFPFFRVLGAHANGNFFDIRVSAKDGLSAFGTAALLMKEAGDEGDATFHVAIPEGVTYDQPGDSLVSLETVLDPEQADVFGLASDARDEEVPVLVPTRTPAQLHALVSAAAAPSPAAGRVVCHETASTEVSVGQSLRMNAPEFFKDPEFIAWLNNGDRKFTWHPGGAPSDHSDVIVLVDPSLNGEGSDSDMPEHIWEQIVEACRKQFGEPEYGGEVFTVRLTNLEL